MKTTHPNLICTLRELPDPTRGVTMVELMISLAVLAVVLLGTQLMVAQSIYLGDVSHEMSVATFDINAVVGHVRTQPFAALTDPGYEDAFGGARVPHGGIVDPSLYNDQNVGTQTHLQNQEIIVYYLAADGSVLPLPNDKTDPINTNQLPTGFETPDPLSFIVECTWTGAGNKQYTKQVTATRTR